MKTKEKLVTVYNKSGRSFTHTVYDLDEKGKPDLTKELGTYVLKPESTLEVPQEVADVWTKGYPLDVLTDAKAEAEKAKAAADLEASQAQIAALQKQLADAEKAKADAEAQAKESSKAAADAEKAKAKAEQDLEKANDKLAAAKEKKH